MDSKINVLGIYIDNYTGKEAMKEAVGYMESDPVNIVELLTVDAVMDVDLQQETKEQLRSFDLVLGRRQDNSGSSGCGREALSAGDRESFIYEDVPEIFA